MEGAGETLIIPTVDEIILLNRRLIEESGGGLFVGEDNMINRGALEHALVEMNATVFGEAIYPTICDKAALLAWRIIAGHVFVDGNKRTGMASAKVFLLVNGFHPRLSMDTVDTALEIATGQMTVIELSHWIEGHWLP